MDCQQSHLSNNNNELITNIIKNDIFESFKLLNSFDRVKEKTYDELKKYWKHY
jgi:hypothetical protein